MSCENTDFLNPLFDPCENIREAPTPQHCWTTIDDGLYDFGIQSIEDIDFQMTNSQTHSFGQDITPSASGMFNNISQPMPMAPTPFIDIPQVSVSQTSSVKTAKQKAAFEKKCMNANAVAARENRAKKKQEYDYMKKRLHDLEEENITLHKKIKDFKEKETRLQERNVYLEKVNRENFRLASIYTHIKTGEEQKNLKKRLKNVSHLANVPGICFHIKSNQEIKLQLCEYCSNRSNSQTLPSNNET